MPRLAVPRAWQKEEFSNPICVDGCDRQAEGSQLSEEPDFHGTRMGKIIPGE